MNTLHIMRDEERYAVRGEVKSGSFGWYFHKVEDLANLGSFWYTF